VTAAYVSMGSNLGDRRAYFAYALGALDALPRTRVAALSPIYETAPVGPPPQRPYLNAAVHLDTGLGARELLGHLLRIEAECGRERGTGRNRPRTLDLDLLIFGAARIREPGLEVPHPRLAERAFVLEPLGDLAPDLVHPALGERVEALARRVRDPAGVWRWAGDRAEERRRMWPSSP
jgi:2-amino-4-hydroxy-6-hydroxymethyldihydropteridine diphosphokinase